MVYNDEYNKPGLPGHMAEYNLSQSSYVQSGNVLSNPIYLQSESQLTGVLSPLSGPIALTSKPGTSLQEGTEFNTEPFKYFINLEQMVNHDDKRPGPGNQYRVVITFEAQTL